MSVATRDSGEESSSTRLRVLIVEDSKDDALLLLRELRRGGYHPDFERVDTYAGMDEALENREWDLVLCDHSMPTFSSSAALALLREKGFLDLPFIIVSGRIGEDAAVSAMKSGAHDYIMKDNLARLNSAIERELREAVERRERRRAEENLLRSERGLAAAQRIARLGNFDYHTDRNEAIWSDELFRVCGLSPQQFVPTYRSFLHVVHPEDRDIVRRAVREALYDEQSNTVEYRIVRPNGETHIVQTAYEVHRDAEGRAVRLTGTVQDITERKVAEAARLRAEEKYRSIFENSVEGIFQTTAEGRLVTANPSLARMFGYRDAEDLLSSVEGRLVEGRLYDEPERRVELLDLVRRTGSVSGFEARMRRRDGGAFWVSISVRAIRDDAGELAGLEGTVEDVTERRRAEENLREMREAERRRIARDLHDEALQDLTHALQTTQVMKRIAKTSGKPATDPKLEEVTDALKRAVGGLRAAIYDLRVEGYAQRSFREAVEALVMMHRRISPECDFDLSVSGDEEHLSAALSKAARGDLLRIIQESLANVRRHSGASHAKVSVGLDEETVWAEISDDGEGFDYQAPPGMGMTGMLERASVLSGRIEFRDAPGSGTTVRFEALRSSLPSDDLVP